MQNIEIPELFPDEEKTANIPELFPQEEAIKQEEPAVPFELSYSDIPKEINQDIVNQPGAMPDIEIPDLLAVESLPVSEQETYSEGDVLPQPEAQYKYELEPIKPTFREFLDSEEILAPNKFTEAGQAEIEKDKQAVVDFASRVITGTPRAMYDIASLGVMAPVLAAKTANVFAEELLYLIGKEDSGKLGSVERAKIREKYPIDLNISGTITALLDNALKDRKVKKNITENIKHGIEKTVGTKDISEDVVNGLIEVGKEMLSDPTYFIWDIAGLSSLGLKGAGRTLQGIGNVAKAKAISKGAQKLLKSADWLSRMEDLPIKLTGKVLGNTFGKAAPVVMETIKKVPDLTDKFVLPEKLKIKDFKRKTEEYANSAYRKTFKGDDIDGANLLNKLRQEFYKAPTKEKTIGDLADEALNKIRVADKRISGSEEAKKLVKKLKNAKRKERKIIDDIVKKASRGDYEFIDVEKRIKEAMNEKEKIEKAIKNKYTYDPATKKRIKLNDEEVNALKDLFENADFDKKIAALESEKKEVLKRLENDVKYGSLSWVMKNDLNKMNEATTGLTSWFNSNVPIHVAMQRFEDSTGIPLFSKHFSALEDGYRAVTGEYEELSKMINNMAVKNDGTPLSYSERKKIGQYMSAKTTGKELPEISEELKQIAEQRIKPFFKFLFDKYENQDIVTNVYLYKKNKAPGSYIRGSKTIKEKEDYYPLYRQKISEFFENAGVPMNSNDFWARNKRYSNELGTIIEDPFKALEIWTKTALKEKYLTVPLIELEHKFMNFFPETSGTHQFIRTYLTDLAGKEIPGVWNHRYDNVLTKLHKKLFPNEPIPTNISKATTRAFQNRVVGSALAYSMPAFLKNLTQKQLGIAESGTKNMIDTFMASLSPKAWGEAIDAGIINDYIEKSLREIKLMKNITDVPDVGTKLGKRLLQAGKAADVAQKVGLIPYSIIGDAHSRVWVYLASKYAAKKAIEKFAKGIIDVDQFLNES